MKRRLSGISTCPSIAPADSRRLHDHDGALPFSVAGQTGV
jgi:hypothetical protein